MQALILAAGRGERMRPLTDHTPKPLLKAGGKPLIQYHIERLAAAGIRDLVINHARMGGRIEAALGSGEQFGVSIRYSSEGEIPLETGGGIVQALQWIEADPFLVVNADIYTDFAFDCLRVAGHDLAQLVLVDNPAHHPDGDFSLRAGRVEVQGEPRYTFSGIGLYRRELFAGAPDGAFPLAPLLKRAASAGRVGGQVHAGVWIDVGTPDRLRELDARLRSARR